MSSCTSNICCADELTRADIAIGVELYQPAYPGCEWFAGVAVCLTNQAGVAPADSNNLNVWDSGSGSAMEASIVCIDDETAQVSWSVDNGSCQITSPTEDYEIELIWGIAGPVGWASSAACCGTWPDYPIGVMSNIFTTTPFKPGTVPKAPAPCSNVPPEDKACCLASLGSGGGGGGGGGASGSGGGGCPGCGGPPPIKSYAFSGGSGTAGFTEAPVQYATGSLVLSATDIESNAFGKPWGHTRNFVNRLSNIHTFGNGFNWMVAEWPYLAFQPNGDIVVQGKGIEALWFEKTDTGYSAEFNVKQTFELDETNDVYKLYDLDGTVTEFNESTGSFKRQIDPAGNTIEVTGYQHGYYPTGVQREHTSGGSTTTEQFLYEYNGDVSDRLINQVTLRRKVDSGPWTNVARAAYTYYDELDIDGRQGDLQTVTTKTWNGSTWEDTGTTLYRYYTEWPGWEETPDSSSSSSGTYDWIPTAHLLKYVVNPAAYARLVADPQVNDPLTTSDEKVAEYADFYFEYDSERRVTKETINGGEQTFTLSYSESTNADGYNSWKTKTVETLPDGSQRIVYSNFAAQPMLKIHKMGTDESYEFFKYNDDSQLILRAEPSAVTGYDDQYADLLHESAGEYEYLRDSDGLIRLTEYHSATGWVTTEKIQKGQLGTAIKLRERQYATGGSATPAVYFRSKDIVYPSDTDQTKKIETSYTYTFHSGTSRVLQRTTTLPAVSAAQNGSGTSATRVERFDTFGNLVWTKDERGYITYHEYERPRPCARRAIQDVDDTFLTVPSGWETPNDGGKHLVDRTTRPTTWAG